MKNLSRFLTKDLAIFAGLSLLIFLTLLVVLSALSRFAGSTPYVAITMVSLLLAYALTFLVLRPKRATLVAGIALTLVIMLLSILISAWLYDRSFDGGSYHKEAVFAFANGWNPLAESIEAWQSEHEVFGQRGILWIDHYAHGVYDIAACFYAMTGIFEAGKCYTLIAMAMAGFICGWYLRKKSFSTGQSVLVAAVLVLNPITAPQFTAFYNDALLMMELLALLTGLFMLSDKDTPQFRTLGFIVVACAFVLCAETKFTGLAYAGCFSLSFYILYIVRAIRRMDGFSWKFLAKTSLFLAVVILSSVLVIGYSPYVTNFLDHGHPFYPLFGEGAVDIVTSNSPASFAGASNMDKLFFSFFSQSDNILADSGREPTLKLPLTISLDEFRSYGAFDLRIGGFGVLYSAILIIQLVFLVVLFPGLWRRSKEDAASVVCFLVPTLLLMLFLGESWWARYSCYSYFVNGIVLALLFRAWNRSEADAKHRIFAVASIVFAALLIVNTGFFLVIHTGHIILTSKEAHEQIDRIGQAVEDGHRIEVAYVRYPGDVYALQTRGIPFDFLGKKDDSFEADGAVNSLSYRIVD